MMQKRKKIPNEISNNDESSRWSDSKYFVLLLLNACEKYPRLIYELTFHLGSMIFIYKNCLKKLTLIC
jgi:hypothetical protein